MNQELRGVWQHIQRLGLGALAHANRHANYDGMENQTWPELSVVQAAHAGELLIKARIAQEHPLLIFDQLPKPTQGGDLLALTDLFERGKTIEWSELPDRLWAATGIRLPGLETYRSFGRLRNTVQHFAAPERDLSAASSEFVFSVIDPFINASWGLFAIDYDEDYEPYLYLIGALARREVLFLVSPEAAACVDDWDVDWNARSPKYREEMERRIEAAIGPPGK